MGGSASKRQLSRSERRSSSSRHACGYSQDCFDYIFPRSYLNELTVDEPSSSSSSSNPHPLPSAPLLPYAYDDEEENFPGASSSTLSMNSSPSYACDVDEEERQIDMAIWESLKATHSHMAYNSSSSQRNESPNHFSGELGGCGICFEVISVPATCDPCGHVSCYECLLRIQGSTNRCPSCRGAITKVMRIYV